MQVGNELGAGKPYKAKLAAMVALGCAFVMGFINVAWTVILRYGWAALFTNDEPVKALVASVMPIMGLCELGNCPQTTGCGILRGTGPSLVLTLIWVHFTLWVHRLLWAWHFGSKLGLVGFGLGFCLRRWHVLCQFYMLLWYVRIGKQRL